MDRQDGRLSPGLGAKVVFQQRAEGGGADTAAHAAKKLAAREQEVVLAVGIHGSSLLR